MYVYILESVRHYNIGWGGKLGRATKEVRKHHETNNKI